MIEAKKPVSLAPTSSQERATPTRSEETTAYPIAWIDVLLSGTSQEHDARHQLGAEDKQEQDHEPELPQLLTGRGLAGQN